MSESPEVSPRSGTRQSGAEWLKRLEQGDRPLASAVERMVRDLQDVASAAEEEALGQLLAATARLDGESTQTDILSALLEEGCRFASRTAFFLTRPGEVRGWAGYGFGSGMSSLESVQFAYGDEDVWAKLAEADGVVTLSGEECAVICRGLGAPSGSRGVLIPFMLRGELGGALYADRSNGGENLGVASLQLLTHSAAQTIETAPVRGGKSSATLRSGAAETPAPAPVDAPGVGAAALAAGAAAVGVAAAAEEPAVEEPPVPEPAAEEVSEPVAEEAAAEVEVVEEPAVEAAEVAEEAAAGVVEAAEEVAAAADDVAAAAAEAVAEEAAGPVDDVDFEMVSTAEPVEAAPEEEEISAEDLEAVEDIPAELEPEPELEDTSEIWTVEEEDEEPTLVGGAPPDELAPVPPEVGQETVRLDVAALQGQVPPPAAAADEEETTKLPQWDVEPAPAPSAAEAEAPSAAEPEPEEPVTEAMPAPDFSEDATMVSPRASPPETGYAAPPAEAAAAEAPSTEVTPPPDFTPPVEAKPPSAGGFAAPPPSKPDATGTTQVVPPTDIQGPGSAFAGGGGGGIPDGEEALHEEARRLARLLVSEIKLYNEEIIEEGRRAGNIYERLKDDIDRSRQMYEERIDPRLLESDADYFRQELVQRLAGGDDRLLGY